MRDRLKQFVPQPIWHLGRDVYLGVKHAAQWPGANLHPWRRESIARLGAYQDKYKGERCFIIGNGPSLKNTDTSKLKNEYTFGMNRIYLAFEEWGFPTSFFVSINDLVIEQCADEIAKLAMPKFLTWRAREWVQPDSYTHYLHTTYTGPKFSKDVRRRIFEGATVTYVTMQLAYFMGFEEVILIGVDHSFKSKGKANETVVSIGDDENHFDARYFGKGFKWQLPDLDMSEVGYAMARQAYEESGRKIVDATVGGQLQIFDKVAYDSLF